MPTTQAVPVTLPLEDDFTDVLGKACKGLKLSLEELADRLDLSQTAIKAVFQGQVNELILSQLAFALNLHGPSLLTLAKNEWYPQPLPAALPGLASFTTWYGDMTVNAYLLWDPHTKEAASFDTGASCQQMLDLIETQGLTLKKSFITHTHMDHLADLDRLRTAHPQSSCYGSAVENPLGLKSLTHGDGLVLGNLQIRVLGTSGHTPGGLSYSVTGLSRPLVVVGDALFAGSMGGAPYAYEEARANNLNRLLALPAETIICPGHGPMTTVAEERAHNPFFPETK